MDPIQGKKIFSGIQPSGNLHIGNYLGALKQWVELQSHNSAHFCIVDLHAITVPYDVQKLNSYILDAVAMYVACGIDPDKSVIFVQSHVPAHAELAWLLNTVTPFGELSRMTQFKDKTEKHRDNTSAGLFNYPILMAADILLYQTDLVPVGDDQKQHIEFTREIARKFNTKFGETFTEPKVMTPQHVARVMSLSDPDKKMSKSDAPGSFIALNDAPDIIRKKIKSAVTETDSVFSFTKSGPAVKNLLTLYAAFSEKAPADIEQEFSGKGYKEFKEALAEVIIAKLTPIQNAFMMLRADEKKLHHIISHGHEKANEMAQNTLNDVKEKMGLK